MFEAFISASIDIEGDKQHIISLDANYSWISEQICIVIYIYMYTLYVYLLVYLYEII